MNKREVAVVEEVVAEVRATMPGIVAGWQRVWVQFQSSAGYLSTRVMCDAAPVDAVRHRALFVRFEACARRLRGAAAHDTPAFVSCDIEVVAGGAHTARVARDPSVWLA